MSTPRPQGPRRAVDLASRVVAGLAAALGCFMLAWILWTVLHRGAAALDWQFFTRLPAPPGVPGGGLGNAVVGTVLMTGLATLVGVPLGLLAGVYLAEFGRDRLLARAVHFGADVFIGVPSIIIGVFVYAILVRPLGGFSGWAGAASLAVIIFPIVARTTEDMLRLVPDSLREAALALGAPRWKVTAHVLMRASRVGVLTGVLLAVARISGETAPLLFTALDNPYWIDFGSPAAFARSFSGPTPNLTVSIFHRAMSPYDTWVQSAWGASLVITLGVLAATLASRALLRSKGR